jgi:hypothetical protein
MSVRTSTDALAAYDSANATFEQHGKRYASQLDTAISYARDIVRRAQSEGRSLESLVPDANKRAQILSDAATRDDWMAPLE